MFPVWLTRLVLALVLAVLPMQGLAGVVQVLLCQPHGEVHGRHAAERQVPGGAVAAQAEGSASHLHGTAGRAHAHSQAAHGSGAHPQHGSASADAASAPSPDVDASDAGSGQEHGSHFCCDVVAAALPSAIVSLTPFDLQALEPTPGAFHYDTFLEFPQRPPLI